MKGYIDENGKDRPPCGMCKYKDKLTVEAPCYNCIDAADLALHKPNTEIEFASFVKAGERNDTTGSNRYIENIYY